MELSTFRRVGLKHEHTTLKGHVSLRMLHAFVGLGSEAGELSEIYVRRNSNAPADEIASEVGDCLWYLTLALDEMNIEFSDLPVVELEDCTWSHTAASWINFHAAKLLDFTKKALFYRDRPLDPAKVRQHLSYVLGYLNVIAMANGYTMQDIAAQNVAKLEARYAK